MVLMRGGAVVLVCLLLAAKVEAAGPPSRRDHNGDPLPPGAAARLGAIRLPRESFFVHLLLCPDSAVLVPGISEVNDTRTAYFRWDLATGRRAQHFLPVPPGRLGSVDGWALFPDGKRLLHWDEENERLSILDLAHNRLLRRWVVRGGGVSCLAVAPNGRLAAVGFHDARVEVHDLVRGRCILKLPGRVGCVDGLAFSADASRLTVKKHRLVRLVYVATGKLCREVAAPPCPELVLSPDGRFAAACLDSGDVGLWELASGRKLRLDVDKDDTARRVAFRPDGKQLLVACPARLKALIVDVATGKRQRELLLRGLRGVDGGLR
jgi:WD40 repeat protein